MDLKQRLMSWVFAYATMLNIVEHGASQRGQIQHTLIESSLKTLSEALLTENDDDDDVDDDDEQSQQDEALQRLLIDLKSIRNDQTLQMLSNMQQKALQVCSFF